MSEKGKPNFLAAGINNSLSRPSPPPPPKVKRPKERDGMDGSEVDSLPAPAVNNTIESVKPVETSQVTMTNEQLQYLAEMLQNVAATKQIDKKAKRQKVDLADLLIKTIADSQGSDNTKGQFSKFANSQKSKINQGIFAPEALFSIYRSASMQMALSGKKTSMGDLMAKALIAYIPDLMHDLDEE